MARKKADATAPSLNSVMKRVGALLPLAAGAASWLAAHPEVWDQIKKQADQLIKARTNNPAGMRDTIHALRKQVDYLADSADDAAERHQAQEWMERLNSCERAVKLLEVPGSTAKDRKALKKRIEAIRSKVFAAYIEEMGEDAAAAK